MSTQIDQRQEEEKLPLIANQQSPSSNSSMIDFTNSDRKNGGDAGNIPAGTSTDDDDAPQDTWNAAYFVLLFLGVALLLTYNSFVAAPDYTSHYYRYAAQDKHLNSTMPHVWDHISSFITAVNMFPNLLCQIAMLSNYVQSIPVLKRLYFAIILNGVAMLLVPIAPAFKIEEHAALAVLLIGDAVCGGATALLQSSAFAIAAQFPVSHMQAAMLGIGVSGTVVSLLQIITYGAIGSSFEAVLKQSSVFFGIGVLALFGLVLILPLFRRNKFARYYILEWKKQEEQDGEQQQQQFRDPPPSSSATGAAEAEAETQVESTKTVDAMRVIGICKWNMLANFFVYYVTLTVFPGMGVSVDPSSDWYGIIIIFLFNFGDFCGRMLCRFEMFLLKGKHTTLQRLSLCRVLFLPLFFLSVKPREITSKVLPMVFMYLVGISNGFTSSQLMMWTPAMEELEAHEKPVAGSAMSLSLLAGCSFGSLTALLLSQVYFD